MGTARVERSLGRRDMLRLVGASAATAALSLVTACGGGASIPTATPATLGKATTGAPTATASSVTTGGAASPTAAAAGSSAAPASVASGQGGTLNIFWRATAPTTLIPLFTASGSEEQFTRLIFGSLVKMSGNLELTPDLADTWDVSPDAKTFTFTLNKNVRWSDGQPLTADDVVFTIERAVDNRTGSTTAGTFFGIAGAADYANQKAATITGLSAPDPYTIRIQLAAPNAAFVSQVADFSGLGILPKHILKDVPPDQLKGHSFALAPTVSAGAYTFSKYEPGQYVEIKRNDNYFKARPALDRIVLKILDPQVALAQLDTGELDFAKVPVSEIARVKKNANLTFISVTSPSITQIAVNTARSYLGDKRVRQALMYGIDRQGIIDAVYGGEGSIVNSPILGPAWMGQPEFNRYPYDPSKAKALLKDANWDTGRKLEMMYEAGGSSATGKELETYNAIIQQQLKDVGVSIDLRGYDLAEVRRKDTLPDGYDLYSYGGGVYRAEPSKASNYYLSQIAGKPNILFYANPKVDQLFTDGVATADQAKRKEAYTEVARILNDEVPTIFLWSPNSLFATSKRFKGFKAPSYTDNFLWNAEEWSVG